MDVATFFSDRRVQEALTAKPTQAGPIVQDFLAQFDLEDCTDPQLLAFADLALRAGNPELARSALDRVIEGGERSHLAFYRLGTLEMAEGDNEAAAGSFRRGTKANPDFPFNWMGRARALHALGDIPSAVEAAEQFVTFGQRPHGPKGLLVLALLADHLYDSGEPGRAAKLYQLAMRFGMERDGDAVRLAECLLATGDRDAALQNLREQEARGQLDRAGRVKFASCLSQSGHHDEAVALIDEIVSAHPDDDGLVEAYLEILVRSGDVGAMRAALANHRTAFSGDVAIELSARIALAEGRMEDAARMMAGFVLTFPSRPYFFCLETGYALLGSGRSNAALAIGLRLSDFDVSGKLLALNAHFHEHRWEEGAAILAAMEEAEAANPYVLIKRFECAAFLGKMEEAERLLAELDGTPWPDRQFALPILRFVSEQQRPGEVIDRACAWIGADFNYDQIGHVLYRAARRSGRQADLIAAIDRIEQWPDRPALVRLRAVLEADRATSLPDIERILADPARAATEHAVRRSLEIKRDVMSRAGAQKQGGRRAIFLCSDRAYLCGTIVALHTLIQRARARQTDFYLVVDDDIAGPARNATSALAESGVPVRVVPASGILAPGTQLDPGFGVFTSGHRLARAAYYRIHFGRHIQSSGLYDRALYVDGDVLVRGSLENLFEAELNGLPAAARLESMRPDVRRAIEHHRIEDNRFFNSGVMLLDLRNERLAPALDAALEATRPGAPKLLFQDQCALNVGFHGDFADMDPIWNYPVGERTKLADIPAGTVILHFLDRPKPWSAAYGGEAGQLWWEAWRDLSRTIGEESALDLLAEAG